MKVAVLLSVAGGGDRQPVVALAVALADAGHDVLVVADDATVKLIESTGLRTAENHVAQVGFISSWIEALADDPSPPNPFEKWASLALPAVIGLIKDFSPDVVVTSLFCVGLADLISAEIGVKWCFVNPSFYFGEGAATTWEEDWHGPFVPKLARECFSPLVERADLVLHGTDPDFDFEPKLLPPNHRYTGFLLWEPSQDTPEFLNTAGDPWALVTASTSRPADEERMIDAAVAALSKHPVRTVVTLPKNRAAELHSNVHVVGFSPHTPILKRSSISVNQAGHGIVSKCLTHGVPMVLLPWDADQPGVANRAKALGVAAIVPREEVGEISVASAVADVLGDPSYQLKANDFANRIMARSPESTAVRLIEDI